MSYPDPTPWEWRVGGRYGHSYVDRYIRGDESHGVYGDAILCKSRKQAQEIVNALNWAFNEGVRYGKNSVISEAVRETKALED